MLDTIMSYIFIGIFVICAIGFVYFLFSPEKKMSIDQYNSLVTKCAVSSVKNKEFLKDWAKTEHMGKVILLLYFMILIHVYHHPSKASLRDSLVPPILFYMKKACSICFDSLSVCIKVSDPVSVLNTYAQNCNDVDEAISLYQKVISWYITLGEPALSFQLKSYSEISATISAYVPLLCDALDKVDKKTL